MEVVYVLKTSKRSRRVRLSICSDGEVVVTAPVGAQKRLVEQFVQKYTPWIIEKQAWVLRRSEGGIVLPKPARGDYRKYHAAARRLAEERLAHFNQFYGFSYNRIAIRNQKTRWGSCSKKGNLNFNYKLALLPPALADYLVVHELCHLKEFNHSPRFWALVAQTIPNYNALRKQLARSRTAHT